MLEPKYKSEVDDFVSYVKSSEKTYNLGKSWLEVVLLQRKHFLQNNKLSKLCISLIDGDLAPNKFKSEVLFLLKQQEYSFDEYKKNQALEIKDFFNNLEMFELYTFAQKQFENEVVELQLISRELEKLNFKIIKS